MMAEEDIMLTDRQNKYLMRMNTLRQDNSKILDKEKSYLTQCVRAINDGMRFSDAVNDLNYNLVIKLKNKKGIKLSPSVDMLSNELVNIYGEPTLSIKKSKGLGINPLTHL